jgi:hypothetical protein
VKKLGYLLLFFSFSAFGMAILMAVEATDGSISGCCVDDRPLLIALCVSFSLLAVSWGLAAINRLWKRQFSPMLDFLAIGGILLSASAIVVVVLLAELLIVLAIAPLVFALISVAVVILNKPVARAL